MNGAQATQDADTWSAGDEALHFSAVFLLFAPVGVMLMMVFKTPQGWAAGLASAAFSGAISTGWAYAFVKRRWWVLVPTILISFFMPRPLILLLSRAGLFDIGMSLTPQQRAIVLVVECIVFISLGFFLFVLHLRRTEHRTARAIAELELARDVHHTLVPPITLTTPIAQVHGRSLASSSMGGDLIDVVVHEGRVDILLGDVSGHGLGAGVVMAMLKSCVRTRLLHDASLEEVVADANRVLSDLTESNMFATFAALRLHPDRTLEYALAGHLPIYHYRAASGVWEQYPNQSLPLGVAQDETFVSGRATLASGDVLAMFTDGLSEVQNAAGAELGIDGVGALLAVSNVEPLAASGADSPAVSNVEPPAVSNVEPPAVSNVELLAARHAAVMAGVGAHGPQVDDQSMVLVSIT